MKLRTLIIMAAATAVSAVEAPAQTVVYSLPSTTIHLTVEAICSHYTPGPYAEYAKKYLGIDVPQEEKTTYTLSNIRLLPYLEADRSGHHILNLDRLRNKTASTSFFEFTSQGLIMLSDDHRGIADSWRFPSLNSPDEDMLASVATGNLTSTETVLYKTESDGEGGFERIAFTQSQVVEKNPEMKAREAAAMILELRQDRINIITGDTDATFSGDALRAAIEEIGRIEDRLTSLFTGTVTTSVETKSFDIIPGSSDNEEIVIAFRISNNQGLMPADEISGRPIVMEIIPETSVEHNDRTDTDDSGRSSAHDALLYRVPSVCTIKITDGQSLLLKTRIPVYQKGDTLSFPLSALTK